MIKIEIHDTDLIERQGKNGAYYKQQAYAHTLDRNGKPLAYPERCLLPVPKGDRGIPTPYQPGTYTLDPNSIRIGRFDDLEIGYPNLRPVAASAEKKTA